MADAPLNSRIECLKRIEKMPFNGAFSRLTDKQTLVWIRDLERDGYISAKIQMGAENVPRLIWDVHLLDKGRQFIEDYDSQRTFRGIWKRHHFAILTGILSIGSAVIIALLIHIYVP